MPTGGAILGASAIGAVATSSAANKAAKAQTQAAQQATNTEQQMYDTTRSDLAPYNAAGKASLTNATTYLNGYGTSDAGASTAALNKLVTGAGGSQQAALQQTPGYQFSLSSGLKAAQNSAAARGLGVSGAAIRGATNVASQDANATFGDQVNRLTQNAQVQNQAFNDQYNRYMAGAQLGENAAAQTGNYGTQTASSVGNNLTSAGNAQAAASMAGATALNNGLSGFTTAAMLNPAMMTNVYNKLLGGASASSGMYDTSMPAPLNYTPYSSGGGN